MADQLLSTVQRHDILSESYIRGEYLRLRLPVVITNSDIPAIDLGLPQNGTIISQIANACEKYGFFQVVNHGITEEMLIEVMGIGMMRPSKSFTRMIRQKKMRLLTSFNIDKEKVHNWREYYLRLHCYSLENLVADWPSKPELKRLSSGEQEKHMTANYYPQQEFQMERSWNINYAGQSSRDNEGKRKRYNTGLHRANLSDEPNTFWEDYRDINSSQNEAITLSLEISCEKYNFNHNISGILIDTGSSVDILCMNTFNDLRLCEDWLSPSRLCLTGFTGHTLYSRGIIPLMVQFGSLPGQKTIMVEFHVVSAHSTYKGILGHPSLNKLQAIVSMGHLMIKFPAQHSTGVEHGIVQQ